jgi:formamidopyrimidine-DNA glycosylase
VTQFLFVSNIMPELPSLERGKRLCEKYLVGKTIITISAIETGGGPRHGKFDDNVFAATKTGMTHTKVEKRLKGATIQSVNRKGKHVWLTLSQIKTEPKSGGKRKRRGGGAKAKTSENGDTFDVLFHFGMSGNFVVNGVQERGYARQKGSKYLKVDSIYEDAEKSRKRANAELSVVAEFPPKYSKLYFELNDGTEFVFICPRRFGKVKLFPTVLDEHPINGLGFDPLYEMPTPKLFKKLLQERSGNVKKNLLDQSFCAGIGNWIADDVCLMARIHPGKAVNSLIDKQFKALHKAIKTVVKIACDANGDSAKFPKNWLFHFRWSKVKTGLKYPPAKNERIAFETIAGRTTAIVKSLQKKT